MTNDKEKERLLEEFKDKYCFSEMAEDSVIGSANKVFDFFYQEIEAREKKFDDLKKEDNYKAEMINYCIDGLENSANKISHLESIIQAADECINLTKEMGIHYHDDGLLEALDKYNELKKLQ